MIKMIVSDMDGTLLDSSKLVSEENKKAVGELKDQGIYFVLATGRIFASAAKYARELGVETPVIACNGALIKDVRSGEIFYEAPIPKKLAKETMDLFEEQGIYYHFYTDVDFYTKELKYTSLAYHRSNEAAKQGDRMNLQVVQNMYEAMEEASSVMKFVAIDEDMEKLHRIREQLAQIDGIEVSQSWYNNIEVMVKGISKEKAMQRVASFYGIQTEQIAAIGDHFNDIQMIRAAGYGIAMGNAEEQVKQAAVYVTATNDEDGFARAIRHLMSNER